MAASSSEFQTKILRRSVLPDEYKLYRAALEWDLTDPIVIETRKDLKSEKRENIDLTLYVALPGHADLEHVYVQLSLPAADDLLAQLTRAVAETAKDRSAP